MTDYILEEKGEEVISDRHQSDYIPKSEEDKETEESSEVSSKTFTDVSFDDI